MRVRRDKEDKEITGKQRLCWTGGKKVGPAVNPLKRVLLPGGVCRNFSTIRLMFNPDGFRVILSC
jgi:hypothetical protein